MKLALIGVGRLSVVGLALPLPGKRSAKGTEASRSGKPRR